MDAEISGRVILNIETLNDLRKLDRSCEKSVVDELLESFLLEVPGTLGLIRDLFDSRKMFEAKKQAHSLKSSATSLGADRLSLICQQIESEDPSSLDTWVNRLEAEFLLVEREMKKQLKRID